MAVERSRRVSATLAQFSHQCWDFTYDSFQFSLSNLFKLLIKYTQCQWILVNYREAPNLFELHFHQNIIMPQLYLQYIQRKHTLFQFLKASQEGRHAHPGYKIFGEYFTSSTNIRSTSLFCSTVEPTRCWFGPGSPCVAEVRPLLLLPWWSAGKMLDMVSASFLWLRLHLHKCSISEKNKTNKSPQKRNI